MERSLQVQAVSLPGRRREDALEGIETIELFRRRLDHPGAAEEKTPWKGLKHLVRDAATLYAAVRRRREDALEGIETF